MFIESSDIYDQIYSFKDYAGESEKILRLMEEKHPACKDILDVACGTGGHHPYLKEQYQVDGLDINGQFLEAAKQKNPAGNYFQGNMADFQLDKQYDVILCLFSSIGYLKTVEEVQAAFTCFRKHLKEGGIMIIEPWITPEDWYAGKLHMLTYEADGLKICRMNQSATRGNLSIIHFHYLLGRSEDGVQHFEEIHELALFSVDQMKSAFSAAGLKVIHDPDGLTGRGLYMASADT